MENSKISVQLEEISIEKVCRTCLNTSDDSMISLYDQSSEEILEKLSFIELISETFGRIMPQSQNLPTRLCSECQKIINKAFHFKKQCINSTQILNEALENDHVSVFGSEDKCTQTSYIHTQFDDENYDTINVQDDMFGSNPLGTTQQEPSQIAESCIKEELDQTLNSDDVKNTPPENPLNESDDESKKSHRCNQCRKSFNRLTHLKRHKLTHKECKKEHTEAKQSEDVKEKEICLICQKTFSSKKYLKTHMKAHSAEKTAASKKDPNNEKPFLCSECGLRFVRNDYLVIHMRRHLGVKPYKCRFCDKGFPRATDLTVHERYHTNEKTHLCNLCGKGFQRAYNLLVHMRVHTGEKPYSCSYCSKSFSQGNDLKAHIRRHTGERFKCDLCSEGFIQGYHLRNHKKTVHGIDIKSHIRRVEKFVSPAEMSTNSALNPQEMIQMDENEQNVKIEADYQFAAT